MGQRGLSQVRRRVLAAKNRHSLLRSRRAPRLHRASAMTMNRFVRSFLAVSCLAHASAGCIGPIEVSGGPARTTHQLKPDRLGDDLRPLIQGEPAAVTRLDQVESDARTSKIFLYSGLGALAACAGVSAASPRATDTTLALVIGTCGVSIVLESLAVVYAPTLDDYGDVLRAYNEKKPETPWHSRALGVAP